MKKICLLFLSVFLQVITVTACQTVGEAVSDTETAEVCPCWDIWPGFSAWEDRNCNGEHDSDEPDLAGVRISIEKQGLEPTLGETNEEGNTQLWLGSCECGSIEGEIFSRAQIPDGYEPTTPVELTDAWAGGKFGFVIAGSCPPKKSTVTNEGN